MRGGVVRRLSAPEAPLPRLNGAHRLNRDTSSQPDILDDRCQRPEFLVGQPNQFRKLELDPTVIRRQSADPTTAVDAVLMCVEINLEIVQQIDGEAPENLVLARQPIFAEFILSGENTSFQCHHPLNPSDCRVEPFEQAIVKLSREVAVAAKRCARTMSRKPASLV